MNIKARINARKIVLVYWYEIYFLEMAASKDMLLDDVEKIDKAIQYKAKDEKEDIDIKAKMSNDYYKDFDTEIAYIIQECFDHVDNENIDFDYIKQIGPKFHDYEWTVWEEVDKHTVTFDYDEMDLVDRVIFVLGYTEYVELQTPKEVMLNEMVELAKRYGDESSSKLVNGIGHKLLSSVDEVSDDLEERWEEKKEEDE